MTCLSELKVDRYFSNFEEAGQIKLHIFCDASQDGYGVVAYLRIFKSNGVHIKFVIGKSRLAPIKSVSIPRLKLEAATLAVKLNVAILREVRRTDLITTFGTDSTTVLHMIHKSSKRFPTFVANRLAKIDEISDPNQWKYVPSNLNPADDATRGLDASKLINQSLWINGPYFLKKFEDKLWPVAPCDLPVIPEEFTVLKKQVFNVKAAKNLKSSQTFFRTIFSFLNVV